MGPPLKQHVHHIADRHACEHAHMQQLQSDSPRSKGSWSNRRTTACFHLRGLDYSPLALSPPAFISLPPLPHLAFLPQNKCTDWLDGTFVWEQKRTSSLLLNSLCFKWLQKTGRHVALWSDLSPLTSYPIGRILKSLNRFDSNVWTF